MSTPDPHQLTTNHAFTKKVYRDLYPAVDPRQPKFSQAGKVVMITGASRGIGRHGISEAFALASARAIIITARKIETLLETERNIKKANANVQVLPLALEITDEKSVKTAFNIVQSKFGKVDVLINNAGLFGSEGVSVASDDITTWWADFEVNVRGTKLVTSYFLRLLGAEAPGTVITLSSGAGLVVIPGSSAYSITKLVDLKLAEYTAAENPNVIATSFHPGIVATEMATGFWKPFAKDTPELAGAVMVWLASEEAKFMNGRYMSTNWDVVEMVERKGDIVAKDDLKMRLGGETGVAELAG